MALSRRDSTADRSGLRLVTLSVDVLARNPIKQTRFLISLSLPCGSGPVLGDRRPKVVNIETWLAGLIRTGTWHHNLVHTTELLYRGTIQDEIANT